jgi:hypothetical protein
MTSLRSPRQSLHLKIILPTISPFKIPHTTTATLRWPSFFRELLRDKPLTATITIWKSSLNSYQHSTMKARLTIKNTQEKLSHFQNYRYDGSGCTFIQALSRACRGIYFGKVRKKGQKPITFNLAETTMTIKKITGNTKSSILMR